MKEQSLERTGLLALELILFLNNLFWEESGYAILLVLSLMWILLGRKRNDRAKNMAIYSILVLVLVIYNPIVAPIGMRFFSDAETAYLRIFYLLPFLTILAYAAADYYADKVDVTDRVSRKMKYAVIMILIIMMSGSLYDKSMYRDVENIYKIDQEALEISEIILAEHGTDEKARILAPDIDDITYGIRQYTGKIVIAGFSDHFKDEETLYMLEESRDFEYVIITKSKRLKDILEQNHYWQIEDTETYYIMKKAEG